MAFGNSAFAILTALVAITAIFPVSHAQAADKAPLAAQPPVVPGFERFHAAQPDAAGGRLLLGELNCTACHQAEGSWKDYVQPKRAPILDAVGARVQVDALRAMILNPQKARPGTTMPDLLGNLPASEREAAAEALVHLLATTGIPAVAGPDQASVQRGEDTFHRIGCTACHDSRRPGVGPLATSIPLSHLDAKYTIPSLIEFLRNPLAVRPSGRMPSLNLTPDEARDVAHYFLRDVVAPANVRYKLYAGNWDTLPDFDQLPVKSSGGAMGFDIGVSDTKDRFGLRFEGFLQIAKEGDYTVYLASDDGSRLWINGQLAVDNDGIHPFSEKSARVRLTAGAHPIRLDYFEQAGDEALRVEISGPGMARQGLSGFVTMEKEPPEPVATFEPEPAKVQRGTELFASLGCASCHQLKLEGQAIASKLAGPKLATLKSDRGCLSIAPEKATPSPTPDYGLSSAQRQALQAVLAAEAPTSPPSPEVAMVHTLTAFNCYACHERGKVGGPEPARNEMFLSTAKEMGDEGRIPPPLDGVGDKITQKWLQNIFANGTKERPYMHARMPKFGQGNVGALGGIFEQLDLIDDPEPDFAVVGSEAKVKSDGRLLSGSKGLSCIKCHNFAGKQGTGIQSLDMVQMPQRLRPQWFVRYLFDPIKYRPGTRMPQPWPMGQALLTGVQDGDALKQMGAIWKYLEDGNQARIPIGMEASPIELYVFDEAVIYRNFIEGAGPRAIAVGLPERVNAAFDADNLRLALIWQGAFIDAGRHWNGRGVGFQGPLGDNVVSLPPGPALAFLADPQESWPNVVGTPQKPLPAEYKFRGYRLEKDRRPVYRYELNGVQVEDDIQGVAGALGPNGQRGPSRLRRTLNFSGSGTGSPLYYRAAVGQIAPRDDGWYVVDNHWRIRFEGGEPIIRGNELLVPIRGETGGIDGARLVQEFEW